MSVTTCSVCRTAFNDTAGAPVRPLFVSGFRGMLLDQDVIKAVDTAKCPGCIAGQNLLLLEQLEPFRESLGDANAFEREQSAFIEQERFRADRRRTRNQEEFLAIRQENETRQEPEIDYDRAYRQIFYGTTDAPVRAHQRVS